MLCAEYDWNGELAFLLCDCNNLEYTHKFVSSVLHNKLASKVENLIVLNLEVVNIKTIYLYKKY